MRLVVVGETELVENAQLIVVFEYGGGLAWRSAQRLLFLDVVGEFAERLECSLAWLRRLRSQWQSVQCTMRSPRYYKQARFT
jgi:hypothetical protein